MGCRARAHLHGLLHMGGRTWDVAHAVSGCLGGWVGLENTQVLAQVLGKYLVVLKLK